MFEIIADDAGRRADGLDARGDDGFDDGAIAVSWLMITTGAMLPRDERLSCIIDDTERIAGLRL